MSSKLFFSLEGRLKLLADHSFLVTAPSGFSPEFFYIILFSISSSSFSEIQDSSSENSYFDSSILPALPSGS